MNETLDWNPLGDVTYRKTVVYPSMLWNIDLSEKLVSVSPNGGLIAVIKDETISGQGTGANRPILAVYNAAGGGIANFRWNSGLVIGLAWSDTEDLVCVQDDGQVLIYSMFCEFKSTFTMGTECRESKVLEFKIFQSSAGTGLVVLNGLYRFYVVNNIYEIKLRRLAEVPGLKTAPSSWCVLTHERDARVLVASENEIYLLKVGGECSLQHPTNLQAKVTAFIEMTASLNSKHVALYTDIGVIWMGSSDLQEKYCEFNTSNSSRPKQLIWCCDCSGDSAKDRFSHKKQSNGSAVVVYWPRTILLVGMKKDWVRYAIEESVDGMASSHLDLDLDGVHLVSAEKHEFLQRVPVETEGIFKIGSMASGALLHAAAKEFEKQSQKADEYLRMLLEKNELEPAIEQCIIAAESEFQSNTQKALLKSASFGKAFLPDVRITDMFVDVSRLLRVLNNVRDKRSGFFLTARQYEQLELATVIDRLIARRQFCLAFHVCKYLHIPENQGSSRVLAHWACYKVQQADMDDEATARAIKNKLRSAIGVSYASIAEKAVDCDKKDLAVKLLDYEQRASEQVRLLIKLGQHSLALEKAVLSGNTDLTYEVIGRLRERSSLSDFLMTVRQHKAAYRLYLKSCKEQNPDMLKHLHEQEDNFLELAHCFVRESYGTFSPEDRLLCLQEAQENFQKARDEFSTKATDEQLRLVRQQGLLEEESDRSFVETSLHDSLRNLLMLNNVKKADSIRKEFKVSEKRWWLLRISTLSELSQFSELEAFSKSKKSPVGYVPFVEACAKHGGIEHINKYMNKVPQDQRVLAWIKAGNVRKAGDLAMQTRNAMDLDLVLKRCGADTRDVAERVHAMLIQLHK